MTNKIFFHAIFVLIIFSIMAQFGFAAQAAGQLSIAGPNECSTGQKFYLEAALDEIGNGYKNVQYVWMLKNKRIKTGKKIPVIINETGEYEFNVQAIGEEGGRKALLYEASHKVSIIETLSKVKKSEDKIVESSALSPERGIYKAKLKCGLEAAVTAKDANCSDKLEISVLENYENYSYPDFYIIKLDTRAALSEASFKAEFDFCADSGEISVCRFSDDAPESADMAVTSEIRAGHVIAGFTTGGAAIKSGDLLIAGSHKFAGKRNGFKKKKIGREGGEITLNNKTNLNILPDALDDTVEISMAEYESPQVANAPAQKTITIKSEANIKNASLHLRSGAKFDEDHTSLVYIPKDADPKYIPFQIDRSSETLIANFTGGKLPAGEKMEEDRKLHRQKRVKGKDLNAPSNAKNSEPPIDFSAGANFVLETGSGPKSVAKSSIIELPYYEQGINGCCWAAAALAVIKAYDPGPYTDMSIYELLKGMNIDKNDGIGGWWSYDMSRLAARIKGYTQTPNETFTFWNFNNFTNYIIAQTADQKPVIANMATHQAVFCGYELTGEKIDDGVTLIYHDPQNSAEKNPPQTPYRRISPAALYSDFTPSGAKSVNMTISPSNPLQSAKAKFLQTIHLSDSQTGDIYGKNASGAGIVKNFKTRKIVIDYINWDIASNSGCRFKSYDDLPEFDEFWISNIPVWNADRKNTAVCSVKSSIHRIKDGKIEFPAIVSTEEIKFEIPPYDSSATSTSNGDNKARRLYTNMLSLDKLKAKLLDSDRSLALLTELRDGAGNLMGGFDIRFNYSPLIIKPARIENAEPGSTHRFMAFINGRETKVKWSLNENSNAKIDETGALTINSEISEDAGTLSINAVEINDAAPEIAALKSSIKLLKSATAEVSLAKSKTGKIKIGELKLIPERACLQLGEKIKFTVLADGQETSEINWTLKYAPVMVFDVANGGRGSETELDLPTSDIGVIGNDGLYTAPKKHVCEKLMIEAKSKLDPAASPAKAFINLTYLLITTEVDINNLDLAKKYEFNLVAYNMPTSHYYEWDFGDKTAPQKDNGNYLRHAYQSGGEYIIKVKVLDEQTNKIITESELKVKIAAQFQTKVFKTYYNDDGETLMEEFQGYEKNGNKIKNGWYKKYSKYGKLKYEGFYNEDKKHGHWKYHNTDGSYSELEFVNNLEEGEWKGYYPTGALYYIRPMVNGENEGTYKEYYPTGAKSVEYEIKNGKQSGKYTSWYENGTKLHEGEYIDTVQTGVWTYYRQDGSISEKSLYENGKCVKRLQ